MKQKQRRAGAETVAPDRIVHANTNSGDKEYKHFPLSREQYKAVIRNAVARGLLEQNAHHYESPECYARCYRLYRDTRFFETHEEKTEYCRPYVVGETKIDLPRSTTVLVQRISEVDDTWPIVSRSFFKNGRRLPIEPIIECACDYTFGGVLCQTGAR